MRYALKMLFLLLISTLLSGCLSNTSYAPVVNAWQQSDVKAGAYTVRKGDTVYSIAWTYGLDYRALAAANNLKSPYAIHPGQHLRMKILPKLQEKYQPKEVVKVYSVKQKARVRKQLAKRPAPHWVRPARGRIIEAYSSNLAGNHGIDIAGQFGEPIRAAAAGQVVYSGDGVRGYGNLLIIKHNDSYLSAYAFNNKNAVTLGQRVRAGQTIAEMGRNNAGRVMLHFEIRRNGKPVNPERYFRS